MLVWHLKNDAQYAHTKYNDKLADFKGRKKHSEYCKAHLLLDFYCSAEDQVKYWKRTGFPLDFFFFPVTSTFGQKTLNTSLQYRSCTACESNIVQLLSNYYFWTIDSHAANGPRKGT